MQIRKWNGGRIRLNIYKKNFIITILFIYMLTKMLRDKLVPNVFEVFSLCRSLL